MSEQLPAIAIVGMSALLPSAPDLASYWKLIVDARDGLTDIPDDHSWSPRDFYDANPSTPDKTWATKGGFIDKVPFDPMDHGVIPVALEAIDTDQLLALIVARECLRDAGLDPDGEGWNRDRTSVILGHTSTNELVVDLSARLHGPTWRRALVRHGVPESIIERVLEDVGIMQPTWQEQSFPGMLANVSAGRIANRLDLGGTNATVDAACASALGALHYAITELQTGRSDLALSGGTDTLNDIFMYMCFSKTPALSRQGDSRPFDERGDGIVISEGIAMFALKRLADAERDGDRVYAVIRGVGTSSDGRNKSIYAPNSSGQVKAVRRAYAEAGFDLETVDLIEAHGTGTKAGDLAEFNGLRAVFGESRRKDRHVALGSVKSQIGHTKATAGAAGLMKVAMALHQRVLPPTAKITAPSPKLDFDGTPLYLNTQARPWVTGGAPRRAGVSAFGFGGTNYHFAVEEYGAGPRQVGLVPDQALFLVGAPSLEALDAALSAIDVDAATVHHASHATLGTWRPDAWVLGFTAGDLDELRQRVAAARALVTAGEAAERDGVRLACPTPEQARIGVVFPGQGSQYVGMGRTAALRHPALTDTLDQAEAALQALRGESLFARIDPPAAFTDADRKAQALALRATEWAQPALGAIEVGLWRTLLNFGVQPAAFAGHSYGELVALHAAGAYDADALWALSDARGRAMSASDEDRGTMAAIRGPLSEIRALVDATPDLVLANLNHPTQGVVAGTRAAVAAALEQAAGAGLSGMEIPVAAAFHSPLVADARAPLAAALAAAQVATPQVPVYANATAAPYPSEPDAIRGTLADQIVSSVDWVGVVRAMFRDGVRTFVECGPKGVLAKLIQRTLGADGVADQIEVLALDADEGRTDGDLTIKRALIALACRGVAVDVAPVLAERLPPEPRQAGSAATVWLAGANFKRPVVLPDRPTLAPADLRAPSRPAARVHADGSIEAPPARRAPPQTDIAGPPLLTPPSPMPAPIRAAAPSGSGGPSGGDRRGPSAAATASAAPSHGVAGDALAALLSATRDSLAAFQQQQARTAEVHTEFLKGQARANEAFSELFRSHTALLERASGAPMGTLTGLASAAPAPRPIETAPAAPATPASHADLAREMLRPTEPDRATTLDFPRNDGPLVRGSDDLPPMLSAQALADAIKGGQPLPEPTRGPAAAPAGPAVDVQAVLFATVADKTGYPADLLAPEMDLESDLGVDSIKRVEILAALVEALPDAPEIPEEELPSLRTLGDLVARLSHTPAGVVAPRPAPAIPPTPDVPTPRGRTAADVPRVVFGVVADKTGYPQDLLGVAMDLEGDLGIDSIKRVEIFAAIQDALPNAPEIPEDELAGLRTLGDIIERLGGGDAPSPEPPPAAAPTPTAGTPDVATTLMATVAERTGYPIDLLQPGMELEGDLGIDSIKRVEILSAIQEALPDLPDLPEDEIAAARTLADLIALVAAHAPGTAAAARPAAAPTPTAAAPSASGPVRREVLLVPAPAGEGTTLPSALVITRDRLGLADRLAAALRELGAPSTIVDPDWATLQTVAEALPAGTTGLIHLAPLGAVDGDLKARVRGAFLLAKCAPDARFFATLSDLGGTFGHEHPVGEPLTGALSGLVKTLAQERPGCRAVAIDIDATTVDPLRLAEELLTDRGVPEIGLSDEPLTLDVVPLALGGGPTTTPLDPGDLVVVSGGARGVTSHVVRELARRYRPAFLLLGRSAAEPQDPAWAEGVDDDGLKPALIGKLRAEQAPFDPRRVERELASVRRSREIRATLAEIAQLGGTATYAAVDATDGPGVRRAIRAATTTHGPVRGLVHGAGVIADKLIADKDPADFDRVFDTKVDGLAAMLAAADTSKLKVVALFSSVAGRYGNRGQADYAMANQAITQTAHRLRSQGVPCVKAFHWGPWAGGMVTPTLAAAFQARGLDLVGLDDGARAFCDELERGGPAVEVVIGGPETASGLLGHADTPATSGATTGEQTVVLRADQTFLADHRIDGKPVLPFVMALEFMADAARRAFPDLRFAGVREVAVLKGVILDGDTTSLILRWRPAQATVPGGVSLAFELLGAKNRVGLPTVHYRGTVDLAPTAAAGDRFGGSNGLGAAAYPYEVREAYERFLFHGPGFQGIERVVGMSDHGIVGELAASRPKRLGVDASTWATDPVTLDSALQLVGLWVREHQGASALPSYVGRYTQVAPFRGKVAAHIELSPGKAAQGTYDATFVDEAGRVVARIEGGQYTAMKALNERYRG